MNEWHFSDHICVHLRGALLSGFLSLLLLLLLPFVFCLLRLGDSIKSSALNRLNFLEVEQLVPALVHLLHVLLQILACLLCHSESGDCVEDDQGRDSQNLKLLTQLVRTGVLPGERHPGHRCVVPFPLLLGPVT